MTEEKTIDIVLADNYSARLCYESDIDKIMNELGLDYTFHYESYDVSPPGCYIREMPENAVIYVHSSINSKNAFFSVALKVSEARPDLKFILRIRDAFCSSDFEDLQSFNAYKELAEHSPHPSRPVSVSLINWDSFFITDANVDEKSYFKHYMAELKQMRGITDGN